jgi:hypothetical protein
MLSCRLLHYLHKVKLSVSVFSNWAATYHAMSTGKEEAQCLHLKVKQSKNSALLDYEMQAHDPALPVDIL